MTFSLRIATLAALLTLGSVAPAGAVWLGLSRDALPVAGRGDASAEPVETSCRLALWV